MDTVNVDSLSMCVKPPTPENWRMVVNSQGFPIIVVRRYFQTLEVSNYGYGPLPPEVMSDLGRHCSYTHKTVPYGYDPDDFDQLTGERLRIKTEVVMLYQLDDRGRFCTGFGYYEAVIEILNRHRCDVRFADVTPAHPNPKAFETHFENLAIHRVNLRPRQDEFLAKIVGNQNGVFQATVGFGKSFLIALAALVLPYARIAVYVPWRSLLHGMADSISRYIGLVGKIGDGHRDGHTRVTVITLDSIHHTPPDIDIAFFDEAHLVCGGQHPSKIAAVYQDSHARLFTLSATPYSRFDQAHAKLELLFGRLRFKLLYPEAVRLGVVVPIAVRWVALDLDPNRIGSSRNRVVDQRLTIWDNKQRNKAIAAVVMALPQDEQVLVLVDKIEHAVCLARELSGFVLVYGGIDAARINELRKKGMIGEDFVPLTSKQQKFYETEFRAGRLLKVIATRVWSTGIDFADLGLVVRASTSSANDIQDEQAPGRTSRITPSGEKASGHVIDFWDRWNDKLSRAAVDRSGNYRKREWNQSGDVPSRSY